MAKAKFERTKPHVNIGTIGHVDHGKTTLTAAITMALSQSGHAQAMRYDEIDKALSNFLKAIAVNDAFHPAYKKAAILFLARGDMEDAIEYFESYMDLNIPAEEKENIKKLVERIKKKQENEG